MQAIIHITPVNQRSAERYIRAVLEGNESHDPSTVLDVILLIMGVDTINRTLPEPEDPWTPTLFTPPS